MIGFFGGTFDPIHFGHLNLGLQMLEKHRLTQVLFCPAHISPHKQANPPVVLKHHRKVMVTLAIEPIPEFHLLDWELEKEGPSYTIDTIRELKKRNPHQQIRLILGQDALKEFFAWKEVEELVHLAPPLVGSRQGTIPSDLPPSIREAVRAGMTQTPEMDISSTAIRERLKSGKYCGHLVPSKVLDYIHQNQLY